MASMKIAQFLRPSTHFVHLRPKFFNSFDLERPISSDFLPSPNDNQSIKRKHNPRMTIYVIRYSLHVGFRLQYQLVSLIWLSFDFFSFSWSLTISFFCGFTLLCVLLSSKSFLFIITRVFSTHFAIKLFYLRN